LSGTLTLTLFYVEKARATLTLQGYYERSSTESKFCWQEENKILDKMHRSKVNEVEKLSSTIRDLEEAVLAGGAAVNAARDFQRQVHELMVRRICTSCVLVSCTQFRGILELFLRGIYPSGRGLMHCSFLWQALSKSTAPTFLLTQ
jgi:hypothetical protein